VLAVIGERSPRGGAARITFDRRTRVIHLHASRRRTRMVIFRARVKRSGVHRVILRVVRGTVAVEGYAITARRR
jgi:hypothetical protein